MSLGLAAIPLAEVIRVTTPSTLTLRVGEEQTLEVALPTPPPAVIMADGVIVDNAPRQALAISDASAERVVPECNRPTTTLKFSFTVTAGALSTVSVGVVAGGASFLRLYTPTLVTAAAAAACGGSGAPAPTDPRQYEIEVPLTDLIRDGITCLDTAFTWVMYFMDAYTAVVQSREGCVAAREVPCLTADTLVLRGDGRTWTPAARLAPGDDIMTGDARVVRIERVVSRAVKRAAEGDATVTSGTLYAPRVGLSIKKGHGACVIPLPPCSSAQLTPCSGALSAYHCVWNADAAAWQQVCASGEVDAPRLPASCLPSDAKADGSYLLYHFVLPDGARDTLVLPNGVVAEALLWELPPEAEGAIRTPDITF